MNQKYSLSILFLFFLFFLSCSKKGLEQEIKSLYNSVVYVPMDSMVYLSTKTYNSVYEHAEYIYIMYVDSTSCGDCAIKHLSDWSILDTTEMCNNERFKYLFVISPKRNQYKNILKKVKEDVYFNEFTFVDTLGVFERTNPNLPQNKLLHTFMITKDGRVKLVGNPITNPQIGSMLLEILSSSGNQR